MPFNLTRYNLQPYNAGGKRVFWLKAAATEKITAQTGTGTLTYLQCNGFERVSVSANGAQGRFLNARASEIVSELVEEAQMSVLLDAIADEAITGEVEQAAEIYTSMTAAAKRSVLGAEVITAKAETASNSYLKQIVPDGVMPITAEETITPALIPSAIIRPELTAYELVDGVASLVAIDTRVCIISTTLKPGQRLVIDASTYNVLLDSQNAIHLHSGEWIDELNRETTEINITARSGARNLSASILYTERYL